MPEGEYIYWIKAICGVITGVISGFFLTDLIRGLMLSAAVYILLYYAVRLRWPRVRARKALTSGIGAYFFLWLLFWILLYSLIFWSP